MTFQGALRQLPDQLSFETSISMGHSGNMAISRLYTKNVLYPIYIDSFGRKLLRLIKRDRAAVALRGDRACYKSPPESREKKRRAAPVIQDV